MIEDFQINPLLVRECSHEIADSCDTRLRGNGRTVHCLMDLARPRVGAKTAGYQSRISDGCLRAVSYLFKFHSSFLCACILLVYDAL
jgi:hypothetical protein